MRPFNGEIVFEQSVVGVLGTLDPSFCAKLLSKKDGFYGFLGVFLDNEVVKRISIIFFKR